MNQEEIKKEGNRLKSLAGTDIKKQLKRKFQDLQDEMIIQSFEVEQNYPHKGYSFKKQYLANFVLKTFDNKYIVINSSASYRDDRIKIQSYDLEGISKNTTFSKDIIASILLYPDEELSKKSFQTFRQRFNDNFLFSPATHVLTFSEILVFLENHKEALELSKETEIEEKASDKNGSYYGILGNKFETKVVDELNNIDLLEILISKGKTGSTIFDEVILTLCHTHKLLPSDLITINATNSILKLRNGGNAKTDVLVKLSTKSGTLSETISIKNTTQGQVSCHDYKVEDFIRVLDITGDKLAEYFRFFQESGTHEKFKETLPKDYSIEEFELMLAPYKLKLMEWALKGQHDLLNLIDINSQVSNFLLINKKSKIKFTSYDNYIETLFIKRKKKHYGIPLGWTYPSKQIGKRIQFKLPIIL